MGSSYQEEFEEIFRSKVTREGSAAFLEWLSKTDFFTAPASTKFHCACPCGLVQHSVSVYRTMVERYFDPETDSEESFAICGLLHDVCKAQFYKEGTRNVKNEQTGAWEKKPYYMIEDSFPYGHGEKSVFLIERFLRSRPARQSPSVGIWADLTMRRAAAASPSARHTTAIRWR